MKITNLKNFFLIFIFFFNSITISNANVSSIFINDISIEASNILSSDETREIKIEKLKKIGEENVDIN